MVLGNISGLQAAKEGSVGKAVETMCVESSSEKFPNEKEMRATWKGLKQNPVLRWEETYVFENKGEATGKGK